MATNIEMNLYNGSAYEVLYPKTAGSQVDGAVASATSATSATKLATSRTIRTNLASTSTASFNGTANITPGVTGTLPVANGGTGTTSLSTLATNLSSYLNIPSSSSFLPIGGGTLTGDLTIKNSRNFGTKINWGDGDYVHISEPTDDCMEIKAKKVNFVLSDSSDSKFTINNSNPFGSTNSDSGADVVKIEYVGTGSEKSFTLTNYSSKTLILASCIVYTSSLSSESGGSSTLIPINFVPVSWMPTSISSNSKAILVGNTSMNNGSTWSGNLFAKSGNTLTVGSLMCRSSKNYCLILIFV